MDKVMTLLERDFELRMESDSFIIVVNKRSNNYVNLYAKHMPGGREQLKQLASVLDKHKAIREEV